MAFFQTFFQTDFFPSDGFYFRTDFTFGRLMLMVLLYIFFQLFYSIFRFYSFKFVRRSDLYASYFAYTRSSSFAIFFLQLFVFFDIFFRFFDIFSTFSLLARIRMHFFSCICRYLSVFFFLLSSSNLFLLHLTSMSSFVHGYLIPKFFCTLHYLLSPSHFHPILH